jgi:hypothetical protein
MFQHDHGVYHYMCDEPLSRLNSFVTYGQRFMYSRVSVS